MIGFCGQGFRENDASGLFLGLFGNSAYFCNPILESSIIAAISLLKLISPHIIPSERQIEKLNSVTDFYFDYFNKIEQLSFMN